MSQATKHFCQLAVFMALLTPGSLFAANEVIATPIIGEVVSVSGNQSETAVSQPVVVATTEIYDAQLVAQNENKITVLFNLHNAIGVQSGVVYGVELYSKGTEGNRLIDIKRINNEPITLGPNETVPVSFTYTAPAFLSGKYEVWVTVKTEGGMVLALSRIDTVLLRGTDRYIDLTGCQMVTGGERYAPLFGVDLSSDGQLRVTCTATNFSNETKQVSPLFTTFSRSVFGLQVATQPLDTQTDSIAAGKKKVVTFAVPLAREPQAYDSILELIDETGNIISPKIVLHYVIQGESATVQNVVFDKAVYRAGDTAEVQVAWSVAADAFIDARGSGTEVGPLSMSVVMADAKGEFCSSPTVVALDQTSLVSKLKVPIMRQCDNPQIIVSLATKNGTKLAEQSSAFAAVAAAEELHGPTTVWSSVITVSALAICLLLLLILGAKLFSFAFVKRIPPIHKEYTPNGPSNFDLRSIGVLLFVGSGIFLGATVPAAEAVTFYATTGGDMVTFTMSTNKAIYSVGESIQVGGSAFSTGSGGAVMTGRVEMRNESGTYASIGTFGISTTPSTFNSTIAGYTIPGAKTVPVRGYVTQMISNANVTTLVLASLPFTIQCPVGTVWNGTMCVPSAPAPTGSVSGNGCEIAVGANTCLATINWNIDHATAPSVKNVTTNTVYSYNSSGSNEQRTITHDVNVVTAFDGTTILDTTAISGTCAVGSTWNGSVCAAHAVPSATISATSCTVLEGASTCVSQVTWSISFATTPNVYDGTTGNQFGSVSNGTNVPLAISYGMHNLQARDGAIVLDTDTVNAVCEVGTAWDGTACGVSSEPPTDPDPDPDPLANLKPIGFSLDPSTTFDPVTGIYDHLFVQYSVRNVGGTNAGTFSNLIKLDRGANSTYEETITDSIDGLAAGADSSLTPLLIANNVPFGTHRLLLIVDQSNQIPESNEDDNEASYMLTVPVPDPGIELHAEPKLVRSGQSTTVSWNTHTSFPMNCSIKGPKIDRQFDPSVGGTTGSQVISPVVAKYEFILRCVEPTTGTTFTDSAWVEVVPTMQEV